MGLALPWVAAGLAALVLLYAGARGRAAAVPAGAGLPIAVGLAALVVCALLTVPSQAPWSPGGTLLPGLLLGGAGVLAGALLGNPARAPEGEGAEAAATAPRLAAAALVFGLAASQYDLFRHGFAPLLAGCSLGALVVGLILSGALALTSREEEPLAAAAAQATLAMLAVGAATFLAAQHRSPAGERDWLALPALFAATLAAALALRGALRAGPAVGPAVLVLPTAAMAWLIASRLGGPAGFLRAVLVGLLAYAVIAWLGRAEATAEAGRTTRPDLGLLTALVVVGASALAFREVHGLGLAVATVCGIAVLGLFPQQALLPGAVGMGLLMTLYRVYVEATGYTRGFQPDFHYYYLGLAAGALGPLLLLAVLGAAGTGRPAPLSAALRAAVVGAAAGLLPLGAWVLVGERPQAALVVGLALGLVLVLSRPEGASRASLAALLGAAAAWAAVQFTPLLAPLGDLKREHRAGILVGVAALVLVSLVLAAALDRRSLPEETAPAT